MLEVSRQPVGVQTRSLKTNAHAQNWLVAPNRLFEWMDSKPCSIHPEKMTRTRRIANGVRMHLLLVSAHKNISWTRTEAEIDRSFWSAGEPHEPSFASQLTIYEDLGTELLDHAFEGFNVCILAYGQTGSGKSYTMMGYGDGDDKGLIPLVTEELFKRSADQKLADASLAVQVEASYLEIYNEKGELACLTNPQI